MCLLSPRLTVTASTAGVSVTFHVDHLSTLVLHCNSENNKLFHAALPDYPFILLLFGQWSHLSFSGAEVKIHDVKKKSERCLHTFLITYSCWHVWMHSLMLSLSFDFVD